MNYTQYVMMTDEWKDGYSKGFADGYSKALDDSRNPYTAIPKEGWKPSQSCKVCDMSFVDEMGRPKVMGYVCSHNKCPSRITC